jgi:hypothetical protein
MGTLVDEKLRGMHDEIQQAISWSSTPKWQKVCEILNGMSMDDMLDELWRIKATGKLDGLAMFAPRADGVNVNRLRAAIGATQDQSPGDLDALLRTLPADQQRSVKSARAFNQAPASLAPDLWPKYYWSVRTLPAPGADAGANGAKSDDATKGGDDDNSRHAGLDVATAITANAPRGTNPTTYTLTLVYRNFDIKKIGEGDTEVALGHEPNVSVQISPDPSSPAVYQAAISLVNVHVKRHWGLLKPDVEFSLGAQGGVAPGAGVSGGLQAQVELHVTTKISLVASSGVTFGPPVKAGDPPDRGAMHYGNQNVDVAYTPFMIGIVGHWDPP